MAYSRGRREWSGMSRNLSTPGVSGDVRGGSRYRGRGGRRGRFGRGRDSAGRGRGSQSREGESEGDEARPRHPPHLRGREIGLWYRDNAVPGKLRQKKMRQEVQAPAGWRSMCRDFKHDITPNQSSSSLVDEVGLLNEANRSSDITSTVNVPGLSRDSELDEQLAAEESHNSERTSEMRIKRGRLPAYKRRDEVLAMIAGNRVCVISGETGCGKTTQIPQFILEDEISRGNGSMCNIICTQPRRISAISVAERVADERRETIGSAVGYQIRLEGKIPRSRGSILFCTSGILLKKLESDPLLATVSHVLLDEVHERDLQTDLLITVLKDICVARSDLRLVLMSATINAHLFSAYFDNCPSLNIPGFTYDVQQYFLEDVIRETRFQLRDEDVPFKPRRHYRGQLSDHEKREAELYRQEDDWLNRSGLGDAANTIRNLRDNSPNDLILKLLHLIFRRSSDDEAVLIFLPGWKEIKDLNDAISETTHFPDLLVIPLHSKMPTVNQRHVFDSPPRGTRKVVLATNIAETSITIDDIVYVINTGKIKQTHFDVETQISALNTEWVSQSNAKQRRGRAGRVRCGVCYHFFTSFHYNNLMPEFTVAEMLRTRLEELCLMIKLLRRGRVLDFLSRALEAPSTALVKLALTNLVEMNALDVEENITPLGYHLARMPVDPHMGKMLLFGALFGCLEPVLSIAACLSYKEPFHVPLGKEKEADQRKVELSHNSNSDHIMYANTIKLWEEEERYGSENQFCWDYFISKSVIKLVCNMRGQFADLLHSMGFISTPDPKDLLANVHSADLDLVRSVVCAGLYPNVARYHAARGALPILRTKREPRVEIHPKSVNKRAQREFVGKWMVYHLKMKTGGINVFDCTFVSPYALLFFGGEITTHQEGKDHLVKIDEWIDFKIKPEIAKSIMNMRGGLDTILEQYINDPRPVDWTKASSSHGDMTQEEKRYKLLKSIRSILGSETH